MNLIAAVDANWGIGSRNQLLVNIPEDMKLFQSKTMGKTVVMGRRTYESFPNGLLVGRTNVILTRNPEYQVKGAVILHSIEELQEYLEDTPTEDVYVIGGGSIYEQLLEYCEVAYVTKIEFAYEADTWLPCLMEHPSWQLVEESEEQTYFDLEYYFQVYKKNTWH